MFEPLPPRMRTALAAIALIAFAMIVRSAFLPAFNTQAVVASPYDAPFDLIDQDNHPVANSSLEGAPRVLFFGYTSCPDICPTTLADLSRWIAAAKPTRTKFAFVTVDPAKDTPTALKSYLSAFDGRIIGLTGAPANISKMLDDYHVFRQRVPSQDGSYSMNHTATVFLVDARGNLQDTIALGESDRSAIAKLKRLDGGAS
ncbi:MAG: SCO family protein [Hyphomicrobium sp.]